MMNVVTSPKTKHETKTVRVNGVATEIPADYKVVKNLMSGKDVVIPENTPFCCDPSTETYWSM